MTNHYNYYFLGDGIISVFKFVFLKLLFKQKALVSLFNGENLNTSNSKSETEYNRNFRIDNFAKQNHFSYAYFYRFSFMTLAFY